MQLREHRKIACSPRSLALRFRPFALLSPGLLASQLLLVSILCQQVWAHGIGEHKCIHDDIIPHEHVYSGRRHLQTYGAAVRLGSSRHLHAGLDNATYHSPRDGGFKPLRIATELRVQAGTLTATQVRWLREVLIPLATDWWQDALQARTSSPLPCNAPDVGEADCTGTLLLA